MESSEELAEKSKKRVVRAKKPTPKKVEVVLVTKKSVNNKGIVKKTVARKPAVKKVSAIKDLPAVAVEKPEPTVVARPMVEPPRAPSVMASLPTAAPIVPRISRPFARGLKRVTLLATIATLFVTSFLSMRVVEAQLPGFRPPTSAPAGGNIPLTVYNCYSTDANCASEQTNTGINISGLLKSGGNYNNVVSYNRNNTPTNGMKIKTNIPYSDGSQMPTIMIEGYNYGTAKPIGISIVWYVYNGNIINYLASSWGDYTPPITLANEGGKLVIFLDDRPYYARFTVRAYAQGMSETASWFNGWTVVDEAVTGTNQVLLSYQNTFGGITAVGTNSGKYFVAGTGGESGQAHNFYATYQEPGAWTGTYPDLLIRYHTGISYEAHRNYGGHRFYTGYNPAGPLTDLTFSVGEFDQNVRAYQGALFGNRIALGNGGTMPQAPNSGSAGIWHNYNGTNRAFAGLGDSTPLAPDAWGVYMAANGWSLNLLQNGNVGVGTTTVNARLEVANSSGETLRLEKASGASIQFTRSGTAGFQIDDSAGDIRFLSSGSTERMRITSSGNVGIGMSPSYRLDVRDVVDAQLRLSSPDNWAGIIFSDVNSSDVMWYNGSTSTFAIGGGGASGSGKKLHVDGGMSVGSSSDVTAVPSNGLMVQGDAQFNGNVNATGNITAPNLFTSAPGTTNYVPKYTSANSIGPSQIIDAGTAVSIGDDYTNQVASGGLSIGRVSTNYGVVPTWSANTAGLLMNALDDTSIKVHDSGLRIAGFMYYSSAANQFQIGRNEGWGPIGSIALAPSGGEVRIGASPVPGYQLSVNGPAGNYPAYVSSPDGYLAFGPANTGWSHFQTDRPRFYFSTGLTVDGGNIGSYNGDLSLQTSGTTRMTVSNSNGYVGINNPSPSYPLDVNGYMRAQWLNVNDTGGGAGIYSGYGNHFYVTANGNYWYSRSGYGTVYQDANGATRGYVYFDGSGFGLLSSAGGWAVQTTPTSVNLYGTTTVQGHRPMMFNPATGLMSIRGNAGGGWAFGMHATGSSGTDRGGFGFLGGDDTLAYYYIGQSYSSPSMVIEAGGDVGIGTTDPQTKLQVEGSAVINGNLGVTGNLTLGNVFLGDVGHGAAYAGFAHINQANTIGYGLLQSNDGNYTLINKQNTGGGYIGFRVGNENRMVILNNGDVGIGTDSSGGYKLNVAGALYASTGITTAGGATSYYGIGQTVPSEELSVNDLDFDRAGPNTILRINHHTGLSFSAHTSYGGIRFYNQGYSPVNPNPYDSTIGGQMVMAINNGGVGIGTTVPYSALDVVTGANSFVSVGATTMGVGQYAGIHFGYREANTLYRKSAIVFERTDNSGGGGNAAGKVHILNGPANGSGSATLADARFTIGETGNVGIGTTNPARKLTVNGEIGYQSGWRLTTYWGPDVLTLKRNAWDGVGNDNYGHLAAGHGYFYEGLQTGGAIGWEALPGQLYVGSTSKLMGYVGIGTDAPAANLDINGFAYLGYEGNIPGGDFGLPLKSGFYQDGGAVLTGDVQAIDGSHDWSHLIVSRHWNPSNNHELQIASTYAVNDRLFFRKIAADLNSSNPTWNEVATRGANTFIGTQAVTGNFNVTGNFSATTAISLNAPNTDYTSINMSRTDEAGLAHQWAFYHMNNSYGRNDLQLWEYHDVNGGGYCTGGGDICQTRVMVEGGTGFVGLNTSNPIARLHVEGDGYINGTLNVTGNITASNLVTAANPKNTNYLVKFGTIGPDTIRDSQIIDNGTGVGVGMSPVAGERLAAFGNITNYNPSAGYLSLSGDLPGYAAGTYPTLKTNHSWIYFSAGGTYSGYIGDTGMRARAYYDFDNDTYYVNPSSTSRLYEVQSSIYSNPFAGVDSGLSGQRDYQWGYQEAGAWNWPYPDLILGYHTGIKMGANASYGGIRFYDDHPGRSNTEIFSVGNGDNNVRVASSLIAAGLNVSGGSGAYIGDGTSKVWIGGSGGSNYFESGNNAWNASPLLYFTGYNGNPGSFSFVGSVGVSGTLNVGLNATAQNYEVAAGSDNGICFWSPDCTNYKIHMGNSAEFHYGPVTDYSIKSNMSLDPGRGWTWGQPGVAPIAALSNVGNMQIAGTFASVGSMNAPIYYDNSAGGAGFQLDPAGNSVLYNLTIAPGGIFSGGGVLVGPGMANYIPKYTGASTVGNSQIYNDATGVGIGTITPGGVFDVSTVAASSGGNRTITFKQNGQSALNFGSYPGAWTTALALQNNDNSRMIWLNPMDTGSGVNSRIYAYGSGLDIFTGGTVGGVLGFSQNSSGDVGIGLVNPGYKLDVQGTIRSAGDFLANGNYGLGLVGLYSDVRYQNVFAMGTSWRLAADGTTPGNLYGLAWTHQNVGGQSKPGLSHQLLVMENGVTKVALGSGIWTNYDITSASLNVSGGNGAYIGDGNGAVNSKVWIGGSGGTNYIESGNGTWNDSKLLRFTGYNSNAGSFQFDGVVAITGALNVSSNVTFGPADATYVALRDDQSPNGVKYIHANDNNIGFLSGAAGWIARWDDAGNQVNTGSVTASVYQGPYSGGNSTLTGIRDYQWGYQEAGTWDFPYPDLIMGYHTGMKMGANASYGGIRFYDDHPGRSNTEIFSVGNGDNNVRVVNDLIVDGTIRDVSIIQATGADDGDQGGYTAAKCSAFPGYHMCSGSEIIEAIRNGATIANGRLPSASAWYSTGSSGAANDCDGWTNGTAAAYGAFWNFTANVTGGISYVTSCDAPSTGIACCR